MSEVVSIDLATLRFEGDRFRGHALDVECTQELVIYRNLILECAKELWRRKHPDRARLPAGFDGGFRLQFHQITQGSTVVPLRCVCDEDTSLLDVFEEAAELIDAAVCAASDGYLLPQEFPTRVLPLFSSLGKTLREDEILFTRARHSRSEAPYDAVARKRLRKWLGPSYEDLVELVGEIRLDNVDQSAFTLVLDDGVTSVSGRFSSEQENLVLDAVRNHGSARMRVRGLGEFEISNARPKRFVRIDEVGPPLSEQPYDESAIPIWERIVAIGAAADPSTWDDIPTDLSMRSDYYLYGCKPENE